MSKRAFWSTSYVIQETEGSLIWTYHGSLEVRSRDQWCGSWDVPPRNYPGELQWLESTQAQENIIPLGLRFWLTLPHCVSWWLPRVLFPSGTKETCRDDPTMFTLQLAPIHFPVWTKPDSSQEQPVPYTIAHFCIPVAVRRQAFSAVSRLGLWNGDFLLLSTDKKLSELLPKCCTNKSEENKQKVWQSANSSRQ